MESLKGEREGLGETMGIVGGRRGNPVGYR
jgi:hypothetical protein